jgi:hypothetical protein
MPPTGSLLASATVPAGTNGRLFGQFRYVDIPGLTRQSGVAYALGALYKQPSTSDRYQDYTANTVHASRASQLATNFAYQCGSAPTLCTRNLVLPQQYGNFTSDGYCGPNIAGVLGTAADVPAPLPILGLGAEFSFARGPRPLGWCRSRGGRWH